ncbi:cholesterol 24-hydroxylase-like isoform X1 [Erpetoichthys calabaricus]|uniref:cholesterol 24-hydroxylase-like isoform X1 n=1 Tax=Erpetoichthys calabaricus TaxID=27687 RepID=UPI0010A0C2E8|nr:cholesterol 24-hydroxylase-like isoform X1 [Erpetoichthys calabaricus]
MALLQTALHYTGIGLLLLLVPLLAAFGFYCLYVKYIHFKFDHIPGPPRDSFLLGHFTRYRKAADNYNVSHELFRKWAEEYGPVVRMNMLNQVFLIVTSPEAVKELLMSQKYTKEPNSYKLLFSLFRQRFFGLGLVTDINHDRWYHQRRIMDPAFSRTYLKDLMYIFNDKSERMMEKLEEVADGQTPVHMAHLINCVTLDVICTAAFGMNLNLMDDAKIPFTKVIDTCLRGMAQYLRNPYMQYFPWHWNYVKEVENAAVLLRKIGKECIDKRKAAILRGEEVPQDILTQILKTAEQEEQVDDEIMIDNFVTFFIAGQETTANQLAFTVLELTRQPEILEKLRAEVDEVIGSKRDVDYEDLNKLTYTSQVLKESLRLYPPAPGTSRWIHEDYVIEGIKIPGKVPVMLNTYIMGRMEKFFKDPLKFDPERFHPDAPKPYFSYFPFSLGHRSCIGQVFSQMEAKTVLAKLLQRYEFKLVPGQTYEMMDLGTLKTKDGVVCTVWPRGGKQMKKDLSAGK